MDLRRIFKHSQGVKVRAATFTHWMSHSLRPHTPVGSRLVFLKMGSQGSRVLAVAVKVAWPEVKGRNGEILKPECSLGTSVMSAVEMGSEKGNLHNRYSP
jgi:hypothetical protein